MKRHGIKIIVTLAFLALLIGIIPYQASAEAKDLPRILFQEKFNGRFLNSSIWDIYPNNGSIILDRGVLTLNTNDQHRFPFIELRSNPFPEGKEFTLSWRMRYISQGYYYEDGLAFGFAPQSNDNYCDVRSGSYSPLATCTALGGIMGHFVDLYSGGYIFNPVNATSQDDTYWHTYTINCVPFVADNDLKCTMSVDGLLITNWSSGFSPTVIETPRITNLWFGLPGIAGSYPSNFSPFQLDYIKITTPSSH